MGQSNPKPDEAAIPAPQAIHHEWRTAENSAAYLLPKIRTLKEQNPKLAILDVGAGSGTISATLAALVPDGHVTALDKNEAILPRARANAQAAGVSNIDFQQGDVNQLSLSDGSFDITHCHQMLCHLSDPAAALREMLRVTKPGGVVAAREGDLETECVWPALPGLVKFHGFVAAVMTKSGGSATGGRQLLSWAIEAGAQRDQIKLSYGTWYYATPEDRRTWGKLSSFCASTFISI